jgi:ubiquinone/menaquinone biosynthesis C-methylase UbiE
LTKLQDFKKIEDLYKIRFKQGLRDYKAVGWGSKESQWLRFQLLCEIGIIPSYSILDVGCGLGDLLEYLEENKITPEVYVGIDLTQEFIENCKEKYNSLEQVIFYKKNLLEADYDQEFDYVFMSGAFNLKITNNWKIVEVALKKMFKACKKGVACNFLSSYVDFSQDKDFHYSPEKMFSIARKITKHVILRHDYPLYEFTLYLYK